MYKGQLATTSPRRLMQIAFEVSKHTPHVCAITPVASPPLPQPPLASFPSPFDPKWAAASSTRLERVLANCLITPALPSSIVHFLHQVSPPCLTLPLASLPLLLLMLYTSLSYLPSPPLPFLPLSISYQSDQYYGQYREARKKYELRWPEHQRRSDLRQRGFTLRNHSLDRRARCPRCLEYLLQTYHMELKTTVVVPSKIQCCHEV